MKKRKHTFVYPQEQRVMDIANLDLDSFATNLPNGVGITDQKRQKLIESGKNNQISLQPFKIGKKLFEILIEPFNLLLLFIGLAELAIYLFYKDSEILDLVSSLMIFFMVCLAGGVDFTQDYNAYKTNRKLREMVINRFYIWPESYDLKLLNNINLTDFRAKLKPINQTELVQGDVIYLAAGDVVPADVRLIYQENLLANQASLTGESSLISKKVGNQSTRLIGLENILFADTIIDQGFAIGVVINVGEDNYASALLKIADEEESISEYDKGLRKITKFLVAAILGMMPIIFVIVGLKTSEWIMALTFALTVAVSLTPEALPAIISSNLQLGSKKLSKNKVVVKNLAVVQDMGSVTTICADKTGTLTLDSIDIVETIDIHRRPSSKLAQLIYLNAACQTSVTNKIDRAIIKKYASEFPLNDYQCVETQAFSHEARETIALLQNHTTGDYLQINKGSVDEILRQCSSYRLNDSFSKLTPEIIDDITNLIKKFAEKGYRLLAIATSKKNKTIINHDLVFEGFVVLQEELKPGTKKAIKSFQDYHLDLKILTGDTEPVAFELAKQLGLKTDQVYSQLTPFDKGRIVNDLQHEKQVVAFVGDGVNDALALKKADVGISVNNATPLAKAAADVILIEKDLGVLENAFVEGRRIFTNAIKFINIVVALNFGLLISLIIGAAWFDFVAMSPLQLLLQNLMYDFANLIFVFDKVDDQTIRYPQKWNAKSIMLFSLWNGLVATIISVTNFLIVGYGLNLFESINSGDNRAVQEFQTIFFLETLFTHLMLVFVYRTEKWSFFQSNPAWQLWLGAVIFIGIAFMVTYIPTLSSITSFVPPNPWWYLILIGLMITAWLVGEAAKHSYITIFKHWF